MPDKIIEFMWWPFNKKQENSSGNELRIILKTIEHEAEESGNEIMRRHSKLMYLGATLYARSILSGDIPSYDEIKKYLIV